MNLLTWKRPKSESTILAEHRILESRDGCYKVVRSRIMVGRQCGYPDAWYAIQTVPRERILGRHRTKEAAMRTCEQHESKIGGTV